MEEFIFTEVGRFLYKIAVLKIKSFLVASAIIICNIIINLEEFCISVSTVSREILVVDFCNSEKWAHCVNYCLAGWIFHRHPWVFICHFKNKRLFLSMKYQHGNQTIYFITASIFHFFIVFIFPPRRRDLNIFWVLILFWRCSYYRELICNSLFSKRQNCIFVNIHMADEYINYS